jgi:7-cyano-7-deazaguanine synthase in queuosine biosynthesis
MKTDPRETSVLLYSGGLDSFIAASLMDPDVLLHVDTGTEYGDVETRKLTVPRGMEDRLARVPMKDLSQWEREEDLILPGRNAHLVLAAAQYGDVIMLGATAGDRTNDKNEKFAKLMTKLLQHMYDVQWWLPEGRKPRVILPIKDKTKRQLVREYMRQGFWWQDLKDRTFSCYYPKGDEPCARCKPCVRKWVALWGEGIDPGYDCLSYAIAVRHQMDGDFSRGDQEKEDFDDAIRHAKEDINVLNQ